MVQTPKEFLVLILLNESDLPKEQKGTNNQIQKLNIHEPMEGAS